MRIFLVDVDPIIKDAFVTRDQLVERFQREWEGSPVTQALDEAVLATLDVSHVGQVITWRHGWIFCAADGKA